MEPLVVQAVVAVQMMQARHFTQVAQAIRQAHHRHKVILAVLATVIILTEQVAVVEVLVQLEAQQQVRLQEMVAMEQHHQLQVLL
jgi:hypothetical protein